jgi:diacylglycerol kinase family enzyme
LNDFEARSIDLCRVGFRDRRGQAASRYFINIAEAGLGGAVVFSVNRRSKKLGGFLTFFLGTLQAILRNRNAQLELQVDENHPRHLVASNIVIGNGKYFGGGMKILPRAEFDDHLLEVLVMGDLSRLELLANLGGVYFGTHLKHPLVECLRASRVKISSSRPLLLDVDGEQPGTTPADFEILPKALKVRMPS